MGADVARDNMSISFLSTSLQLNFPTFSSHFSSLSTSKGVCVKMLAFFRGTRHAATLFGSYVMSGGGEVVCERVRFVYHVLVGSRAASSNFHAVCIVSLRT